MASKKVASKFSAASDAYTEPITRSCSKGITQEQDQGSTIAQSIFKQLMESPKAELSSKKILCMIILILPLASERKMERKINLLMKVVEEQDHKIIALREQIGLVKLPSQVITQN
ncbi:ty3-gypsy retrotransposon protein [Cucumis melo var. makuwa]|uniref:Ty3-gypsy retrotransposon protein n=1 Tax=Cucumis melo var. makuwa TaxID=1194695 RepID=A0A5D3D6C8_CUCMM|nr:ty3-gypsy retrotransposon protein [Cucumis melo var. makuwa]TYK19101.1 ty3-gypsy retrotransposon protein [Cucumis melo var. makuwa]